MGYLSPLQHEEDDGLWKATIVPGAIALPWCPWGYLVAAHFYLEEDTILSLESFFRISGQNALAGFKGTPWA